ncbi:helix-turn-helix domain-containing protein [Pseudaquabacterium pictum]|uniref:helix-turn-helix domain-containing protein n=1 Tax=Pseudaquabacterium pictum TaxID=2315236 RepID=UPI0010F443C7|nr:helix-turn-helix domain-containing protein [Rubrivivax pictus]
MHAEPRDDGSPGTRRWSTADVCRSDTTDAWQSALNDNYGHWQVTQSVGAQFAASTRNRDFNGVRVVECVCDPCTGRRLPQFIDRDPQPYIGVQITKAGRERFHLGGEDISLGAGDLVIWTSTQAAEFTVMERLHKVSLVLPWSDIQERLPRGTRFNGTVIDSRVGIGAVLYSHVDSLARQLDLFTQTDHAAVRRATLELLTAAMSHRVEAPQRGLAMRYLKQLQDYILANLQDEQLSPTTVATANNMSPRYVHMLFAQIGVSASSWIRQQRLERCRDDLRSRTYRDCSVAEIAYTWGFADPSHFTRIFKQQFGVGPRAYREAQPR